MTVSVVCWSVKVNKSLRTWCIFVVTGGRLTFKLWLTVPAGDGEQSAQAAKEACPPHAQRGAHKTKCAKQDQCIREVYIYIYMYLTP